MYLDLSLTSGTGQGPGGGLRAGPRKAYAKAREREACVQAGARPELSGLPAEKAWALE